MTAASGQERPERTGLRVVVTVGTDHHPFDRLVRWINDWLDAHPEQVPGFFMQFGTASIAPACPGSRSVEIQRLDAMLDQADVIVCHGGPASIAGAWARGRLPIVVPRLAQLGEHIDDHQLEFSTKLAQLDRIWLAQTSADFASIMTTATGDPARLRATIPAADVDAAVAKFGKLIEDLVGRPRRLRLIRRGGPGRNDLTVATGVPTDRDSLSRNSSGHRGRPVNPSAARLGRPPTVNEEQE